MAPLNIRRKKAVCRKTIIRLKHWYTSPISLKHLLEVGEAAFGSALNPIVIGPRLPYKEDDTTVGEMTSMHSFSKEVRLGYPQEVDGNPNLLLCDFVIVKYTGISLYEEKKLLSVYLEEDEDHITVLESVCKDVIREEDELYIKRKLNCFVGYNKETNCSQVMFGERLYHCTTTSMDRVPATAQLTFKSFTTTFPRIKQTVSDVRGLCGYGIKTK